MSAEKVTPKSDEESVGGVVNLVTHTLMDQSGSESTRSEPCVWQSPTDPARPKYWPRRKKWMATILISAFGFLQPLSETMLAPAEESISQDLDISDPFEWILVNSLILVGVGLAPLIMAPLSEVYGRKPILLGGSICFTIWTGACGGAKTLGQLLALRALSGFGASAADTVAGGVLSDMWKPEERGKAFAVFMAAPLLGPGLGPICGAFIVQGIGWRWIFYIAAMASAVCILAAAVFLPEMYEPRLEYLRLNKLNRVTGSNESHEALDERLTKFSTLMGENLQRPFRMLATQVIVQLLAAYFGLMYGICFIFLFMYPRMWREQYGQSVGIGSLNYISFSVGLIMGVSLAGNLNDRIYLSLKARNNGIGRPEFRVPTMVIGTLLIPIGLIWWGWAGEVKLHWVMPNIGSLLFAMGVYINTGCAAVYTIDTYSRYAASAISTNLLTRSLTAAFFPLFAPYMFDDLGFGLGATVLAAVFLLVGSMVVSALWFFGETLRNRSPYCAAGDEVDT